MDYQPSASFSKQSDRLKAYEKQKRLHEDASRLKNRLDACKEVKKNQETTSFKDLRSVQHFELLKKQQEEELESLERNLEIVVRQFQQKKEGLLRKQLYVEDKLAKAVERVESQKTVKTKEHLTLEKQIKDIITKYDLETIQAESMKYSSDVIESLRKELGSQTLSLPPPPPPVTPSFHQPVEQPKPALKQLEDKNPLKDLTEDEVDSLSQQDLLALARQMKQQQQQQNPYNNVIQSSKPYVVGSVKRKPKQVDG